MFLKIPKTKKVRIIFIVSGIFLFSLLILNNYPINVTPKSLFKYPVIDDCRKEEHVELDNNELSPEELKIILKQTALLEQFKLRRGYSLGRIRVEKLLLPSGNVCYSYFRLGVRNNISSTILYGEDQLQAFIIKEEELPAIGQLLYGEPGEIDYKKRYSEWIAKKPCTSDSDRNRCVSFKSDFPLEIENEQLTQNTNGDKILHRFTVTGISDRVMLHKKLTVNSDGLVKVESQELIQYRTGILY